MLIHVDRYLSNDFATLSRVTVKRHGVRVFRCFGLEDEYRKTKAPGETRIPAGDYQIRLRTVGGFHERYKRRFPDIHRGMLHLQDVPGFEYILIHVGNFHTDTAGCLLVGSAANEAGMFLTGSVQAYLQLYAKCVDAAEAGDLTISIIDNDRAAA